jgi:GH25 family lysozyme M1 (1,4-beta-N-acetylmuramidase)
MAGETYGPDASCSNPHGRNPRGPTLHGIDISSVQGVGFDFARAAADGIRFVWSKAVYGATTRDKCFARNWAVAQSAGLLRGAYDFIDVNVGGKINAANFLQRLAEVGGLLDEDIHPMLDIETAHGVSAKGVVEAMFVWKDEVENRLGRPCCIYTGPSFWNTCVLPALSDVQKDELKKRELVIAHYVVDPDSGHVYDLGSPIVPSPFLDFGVWQTSGNKGPRIPGVGVDVDRDVFWGDEIAFRNRFTMKKFEIFEPRANGIRAEEGEQIWRLSEEETLGEGPSAKKLSGMRLKAARSKR